MNRNNLVDELSIILVKNHVISFPDAQALRRGFADRDDMSYEDFLLEQGIVEKDDLLQALSEYYKVPAMDVIGEFFNHQFLRLIPKEVMIRHDMIPFWRDADTLTVVAANPSDPHLPVVLGKYVTHDITFMVGIAQDIQETIEEFYDASDTYQPNDIANRLMERSSFDAYSPERIETEEGQIIPLMVEETDDDYESK